MSKKKIVFFLFLIIFIAMCVFYALQMRDYKKIEIFDVSGITDGTNQFLYDVDAPLDSDYIVVSGYCYQNFTKYQRNITKEKLINGFIEFKTFTSVGRHFNVSDKTISKWCESFGLPQTSKKMKEYLSSI